MLIVGWVWGVTTWDGAREPPVATHHVSVLQLPGLAKNQDILSFPTSVHHLEFGCVLYLATTYNSIDIPFPFGREKSIACYTAGHYTIDN